MIEDAVSNCTGEYVGVALLQLPLALGFLGLVLLVVALWWAGFMLVWGLVVLLVGFAVMFFGPPTVVFFSVGFALVLVAQGRSNPETTEHLYLSLKTVRNHVSNIFAKLQVADRAQTDIRAREAGLG